MDGSGLCLENGNSMEGKSERWTIRRYLGGGFEHLGLLVVVLAFPLLFCYISYL